MVTAFTAAAAASGLLAIAADWNGRRHRAFYVLKPLTTALVIGCVLAVEPASLPYQRWLFVALGLALVGDVCLMFPGNRAFLGGLAAFLLAHFAFVAAFLQDTRAPDLPGWLAAIVFYAIGLLVVLLPRAGRLKPAVLLYCLALGAMVFAAAARHASFGDGDSLRALLGALAFMASDSLLGWRRFVGDYRGAQALILSTYWLAIGLIAWSV